MLFLKQGMELKQDGLGGVWCFMSYFHCPVVGGERLNCLGTPMVQNHLVRLCESNYRWDWKSSGSMAVKGMSV